MNETKFDVFFVTIRKLVCLVIQPYESLDH